MRTGHWLLVLVAAVGITAFAMRQTAPAPEPPAAASPMSPIGSIREVMKGIVEPSSNVIFNSAGYKLTYDGFEDLSPKNDEEWLRVRHNALMLAESTNLLKMLDRKVSFTQDQSEGTGDEAPELTPAEIEAKIAADQAAFLRYVDGLRESALGALKAADTKDKEALLAIGDAIDKACENCHLQYWYPEEDEDHAEAPAGS